MTAEHCSTSFLAGSSFKMAVVIGVPLPKLRRSQDDRVFEHLGEGGGRLFDAVLRQALDVGRNLAAVGGDRRGPLQRLRAEGEFVRALGGEFLSHFDGLSLSILLDDERDVVLERQAVELGVEAAESVNRFLGLGFDFRLWPLGLDLDLGGTDE